MTSSVFAHMDLCACEVPPIRWNLIRFVFHITFSLALRENDCKVAATNIKAQNHFREHLLWNYVSDHSQGSIRSSQTQDLRRAPVRAEQCRGDIKERRFSQTETIRSVIYAHACRLFTVQKKSYCRFRVPIISFQKK